MFQTEDHRRAQTKVAGDDPLDMAALYSMNMENSRAIIANTNVHMHNSEGNKQSRRTQKPNSPKKQLPACFLDNLAE